MDRPEEVVVEPVRGGEVERSATARLDDAAELPPTDDVVGDGTDVLADPVTAPERKLHEEVSVELMPAVEVRQRVGQLGVPRIFRHPDAGLTVWTIAEGL